ncbi:MAG: hypothetical protein QOJ32_2386 [Frankiaceae bacterium]|jgi:catechol 2,3-dioxygenase-like lactoylglutathione lyase family enzyme|nr:hypothetical protein [Frankiaceae bacterium]
MSDPFKTTRWDTSYRPDMTTAATRLRPALVELVVADMATTLAFYRRLGVDIPADADGAPHVEADLGGLRIAWDTEDVIRSFDPDWTRPSGGHRTALGFRCDGPEEVDAAYAELTEAGYEGHLPPWDAVWGMRYAILHDPDGRPVDLFAPL